MKKHTCEKTGKYFCCQETCTSYGSVRKYFDMSLWITVIPRKT